MTRLSTPIWLAARPTPPTSYSVSIRSSASDRIDLSILRTFFAFCLSATCGYSSMGRTANSTLQVRVGRQRLSPHPRDYIYLTTGL